MRSSIGVCAASVGLLAVCLVAPAAAAQPVVPSGNSAVNQYTETYPTAGGNATGPGGGRPHMPAEALGARNARRLEEKGPEGRTAAALAAATVPVQSGVRDREVPRAGGSGGKAGATGGSAAEPDGSSSGIGEVLGQATGSSSSDGLGLLLPLVVLLAVAGSAGYAWRRRGGAA